MSADRKSWNIDNAVLPEESMITSVTDQNDTGDDVHDYDLDEASPSVCSAESEISNFSEKTLTCPIAVDSSINETTVIQNEEIKTFLVNESNVTLHETNNYDRENTPAPSNYKFDFEQNLTNHTETPNGSSSNFKSIEMLGYLADHRSSVDLIDNQKKSTSFESDGYSYKSSLDSLSRSSINLQIRELDDDSSNDTFATTFPSYKQTLMDNVINLAMFPHMSASNTQNNYNDIIVARRMVTNYPMTNKSKEEVTTQNNQGNICDDKSMNSIVQKPIKLPDNICDIKPKAVRLFNEITLTNIMKTNAKHNVDKFSDELCNDDTSNIGELWEKLMVALDVKVRELEQSLSNKILTEMKISLNTLDQNKQSANKEKVINHNNVYKPIPEVFYELDKDLQCDLIEYQESDQSNMVNKKSVTKIFQKDSNKEKEIGNKFNQSFVILKPVVKAGENDDLSNVIVDKQEPSTFPGYKCESKFSTVWYFAKENAVFFFFFFIFILRAVSLR